MNELPSNFEQLKRLDRRSLKAIHMTGCCPNLSDLHGIAKGTVLDPIWFEYLRLWRGKAFSKRTSGEVYGKNIVGIGLISLQKYDFDVRIVKSAFGDRQVAYLDHDQATNPGWVRRFHDEMVELHPGFYLACSHYKMGETLRYMSYFAFDFR